MPSVFTAFKINYLGPSYNLPQPYVDKETLQTIGVTIAGLSLTSGKVGDGRAAVLEPVPYDQMERWISQTGTKTVDNDLANFVSDLDFGPNPNHKEAGALFRTLRFYLGDDLLGKLYPNILDDYTHWAMFPNGNTFLLDVEHSDWYVHSILRFCQAKKNPPTLDPRFPHSASFVSESPQRRHLIKERACRNHGFGIRLCQWRFPKGRLRLRHSSHNNFGILEELPWSTRDS
ncbi:hypothetical protein V2G26_020085 [Clonostachys chloroleuca]